MTFRLAHISDIHLGPLPEFKRRDLLSKRITGYINWKRNRSDTMDDGSLDRLLAHLKASTPDHIAVTGDLVNLALDEEIVLARRWLDGLGDPADISVVPGNHDTYVPGALKKIIEAWKPFMTGDQDGGKYGFPYRRDRSPVALLGANSGRATLPFLATGSFKGEQAKAMAGLLDDTGKDGLFRVVMIHHPPFKRATSAAKRLVGSSRFRAMINKHGAELILHGHTHIDSFEWIDGPDGAVPVVGVPSASQRATVQKEELSVRHSRPSARYNLFDISGSEGRWNCSMSEFGVADAENNTITEIQKREIYLNGSVMY